MNNLISQEDMFLTILSQLKSLSIQIDSLKSQKSQNGWLTTEEAANFLKVTPRTMQNYRDLGTISFSQVGCKIYYKLSDLESQLENNYVRGFALKTRRA